jgi:hypothetical protein
VVNAQASDNQTIPVDVARKIDTGSKRTLPTVHALGLDGDFSTVTSTPCVTLSIRTVAYPKYLLFRHGSVNFAIIGTSTTLNVPKTNSRRTTARRSFFDSVSSVFGSVKSSLSSAAGDVESVAGDAVQAVENGASCKSYGIHYITTLTNLVAVNNVNVNKHVSLQPVDVNKQFTIADASVECGDLGTLKLTVHANVKAHADVALGVVAAGTLVPPHVSTFSLSAGLNTELDGQLTFTAGAMVRVITLRL